MIKHEYIRFIQTLDDESVSDDVRKISNIVLNNLDILIPLTTSHGKRVKEMVRLAQEGWNSASTEILISDEQLTEHSLPFDKLKNLSVGPFRGFARKEEFDLNSNRVLIYGPNGTGKTSFCEALEYCLLGNVAAAENKRFRNQESYLKNAIIKSFISPVLIGVKNEDNSQKEFPVIPDESLYRFCFVEKIRIDNFSNIAAQVPAKQNELISILFGLEGFSDFVRNFTDSMDRYIDIEGEKSLILKQKSVDLESYKEQIEITIPQELKVLESDEKTLAEEYNKSYTFPQMVLELSGSEDKKGLIDLLDEELLEPIAEKNNLTISGLRETKQSLDNNISLCNTKKKELSSASEQVSYKKLYEAVSQLKTVNSDICPACHTPLSDVVVDPFQKAETELIKLQYLSELQEEIKSLDDKINNLLSDLSKTINKCCKFDPEDNILSAFRIEEGKPVTIDWWQSLNEEFEDNIIPWGLVESYVMRFESEDVKISEAQNKRKDKQEELKRLRIFKEKIIRLQTRKDTLSSSLTKAKVEVDNFEKSNASLIKEVENEKDIIIQNLAISKAYADFVQKLNNYKNNLPGILVADLGEKIVELYNKFNRNDPSFVQLESIQLPLQQNERLEVSFKGNPTVFYDALHVLSEGHIRCLGLSILMAKNLKENCPLLIFDDPVNAIDDEHRSAIRQTIFEDSYYIDKQVILACHGEEFFKDIQNDMTVEQAKQIKRISFLHNTEDYNIKVDHNSTPRNYIVAARLHYDKGEIRDSLGKARKALEVLTKNKLWKYVNKNYNRKPLSISLTGPKSPIELRNLSEQLKSKISESDFNCPNKNTILEPLNTILGINGNLKEWRYLNSGAHNDTDRSEYDQPTVNKILTCLEQLDDALVQL